MSDIDEIRKLRHRLDWYPGKLIKVPWTIIHPTLDGPLKGQDVLCAILTWTPTDHYIVCTTEEFDVRIRKVSCGVCIEAKV